MFNRQTPDTKPLDDEIKRVHEQLANFSSDSDEYKKAAEQLERLYKMRSSEKKPSIKFSPDTMLTVGANLAGIILILSHERLHVVSSKALGFVLKSKV